MRIGLELPLWTKTNEIEDVTQKTTILLSSQFHQKEYIHNISIFVTGHLDGAAIIHRCIGDGSKFTTYYIRGGDICLKIWGEWYSNECLIKYEPLDVVSGTLKIKYSFNSIISSGNGDTELQGIVSQLFNATKAGNLDEVKTILEETPELINAYSGGSGLLHFAAIFAEKELVEFLIANGLEVDAERDINGFTALHLAALRGHKKMINFLIEKGTDVNAKDYRGETALKMAVDDGHAEIAELLRKHGGIE